MEVVPLGQASALIAGIDPELLHWNGGVPSVKWPTQEAIGSAMPDTDSVAYSEWESGRKRALAECNTEFRRIYDVALSAIRGGSLPFVKDEKDPLVRLSDFVRWAKTKSMNVHRDLWFSDFDPKIDWAFWSKVDTAKVFECVALFLRLSPKAFELDRTPSLIGDWKDCLLRRRIDVGDTAMEEFEKLVELAGRAIKAGTLKPCSGAWNDPERILRTHFVEVPLAGFIQWAASKGYAPPPELCPAEVMSKTGSFVGWKAILAEYKRLAGEESSEAELRRRTKRAHIVMKSRPVSMTPEQIGKLLPIEAEHRQDRGR